MSTYFDDIAAQGMRGVGAVRPDLFIAFLTLANETMHKPSRLTSLQREVLGAYLSKNFGCDFCHLGHLDTVEAIAGTEARQIVDAPTEDYKALFRFADQVVANEVSDQAIGTFIAAGFDEQAAQDVVFVAALFGFANRMVTGFKIHYREDRDRASSMALANGYLVRPKTV